jgi:hypothetical protein
MIPLLLGAVVVEMTLPHSRTPETCACYHPHAECGTFCGCPLLEHAGVMQRPAAARPPPIPPREDDDG